MADVPAWAVAALADVYDPCCREKGISVLEMGLVRSVRLDGDRARAELLLTTGWCPFASGLITQVRDRLAEHPGVTAAEVEIVWDEAWTTDRLSPRAARLLRFLPPPAQVPDRAGYLAAHLPDQSQSHPAPHAHPADPASQAHPADPADPAERSERSGRSTGHHPRGQDRSDPP